MINVLAAWTLFKTAVRQVKVLKWALGIAGLGAAVSIVLNFKLGPAYTVFGILISIAMMALLSVCAVGTQLAAPRIAAMALVFLWGVMLLSMAALSLLLTCYFFSWPRTLGPPTGTRGKPRTEVLASVPS